jgi:hypothetical protein
MKVRGRDYGDQRSYHSLVGADVEWHLCEVREDRAKNRCGARHLNVAVILSAAAAQQPIPKRGGFHCESRAKPPAERARLLTEKARKSQDGF